MNFTAQNDWRSFRIEALFAGVADLHSSTIELASASTEAEKAIAEASVADAKSAIESAKTALLTPANSANDYGFRSSDYSWYASRYQGQIDGFIRKDGSRRYGLQETLIHKTGVTGRMRAKLRGAYGEMVTKTHAKIVEMEKDIHDIKERVSVYSQLTIILNDMAAKYTDKDTYKPAMKPTAKPVGRIAPQHSGDRPVSKKQRQKQQLKGYKAIV